jgi:hypothetical protein
MLLDALRQILLNALRQAIERDEATDGKRDANGGKNGPRRSSLEIAERELKMVQLAASRGRTEDCSDTRPSLI